MTITPFQMVTMLACMANSIVQPLTAVVPVFLIFRSPLKPVPQALVCV